MHIYDLIGIGFGPSNIALAIALEERNGPGPKLETLFLEKQPGFAWHANMLLDNAHMQISFLKDLATLRNPASHFTFINYLHEKQRLQDFINLKTFFPSRHEFNDYLAWAAAHFDDRCRYSEEVFEILPEQQGNEITLLRLRSRDHRQVIQERLARHLVIGIGGSPRIPDCFHPLREDPRVFHSSRYLSTVAHRPCTGRVAVVGAGQSAAEIFMDLHNRTNGPQVDLIMRARAITPSDDSPFVNEIFNADFTDYTFSRTGSERAALLEEFWHTNYAAPDLDLIEQIFTVFYRQKVSGVERHRFLRRHEVQAARASTEGIHLTLLDLNTARESTLTYDSVILATGYRHDGHKSLLEPLSPYLPGFAVDRYYRLQSTHNFRPAIFLQGACESTHGLSDTLLSVTAIRAEEIIHALLHAIERPSTGMPRSTSRAVASL